MDEENLGSDDGRSKPLEALASDNEKLRDGERVEQGGREDRGHHVDIQALREVMYALHDVSIGTHQLLYFSAMKYCKNYVAADADTLEAAIDSLAGIFDALNVGTLSLVEQENGTKAMLKVEENALAFDADTDKPICYFLSGYIAGYLENALEEHYVVNETACISQGNEACLFSAQKR